MLACVSYGKILSAALLQSASLAALNVHPSLLPLYRGATPIQAALRDGCDVTGVSVIWMSAKMDAGDIALERSVGIEPSDDYGTLHDKLALVGSELLVEAAEALSAGRLPRTPQDAARATFTKPLRKEDLRLDFDAEAKAIVNKVRSLSPKPAAWAIVGGKRVKVLKADPAARAAQAPPGGIIGIDGDALVVACRDGAVGLLRVIPESKPSMTGAELGRLIGGRPD